MKKFLGILLCAVMILSSLAFSGCSNIYGGKYTEVDYTEALNFVTEKEVYAISKGNVSIDFNANVFGIKSKSQYDLKLTGGSLQAQGHSKSDKIDASFYYTGGYAYLLGSINGEKHKIKQVLSLEKAIFGDETAPVLDDGRITESVMFDAKSVVESFGVYEECKFYTQTTDEYYKIKIVLYQTQDYPVPGYVNTVSMTQTAIFVFNMGGRFVASKLQIDDETVSRGYKEKSTIKVTTELFDGDISLPSAEELETYTDISE